MVQHGHELLGAAWDLAGKMRDDLELIPDLQVLDDELIGVEASHDLDCLQLLMDVSGTYNVVGYQAVDWLRENKQIDVGMADHRRILATRSFADDKSTTDRLLDALCGARRRGDFDSPPRINLPSP